MKIDLQKDLQKVRHYIERRIKDYPDSKNIGPGREADPISLITVGYYATQGGYINVVFDTRPEPDVDGEWTTHIDNKINTLMFPEWEQAYEELEEGNEVNVTLHDGSEIKVREISEGASLNTFYGEMLTALMKTLRADGTLAGLPLSPDAFFSIEEFDFCYSWPDSDDDIPTQGRILNSPNQSGEVNSE